MGRRLPESERELQGDAERTRLFPMSPMLLRETARHCKGIVPALRKLRSSSWWSEQRIPRSDRRATRKDKRHHLYRVEASRQASPGGVAKDAVCLRRPRRARFFSRQEKSRSIRALRPAAEVWKAAARPRVPKHFENGGVRGRKPRNRAAHRQSEAPPDA